MKEDVKAAVLTAPKKFETRTFPTPEITRETGLVRMLGAGICGTDKHVFTMGEIRLGLPGDIVRLPIIMGHENLGIIEAIGSEAAKAMVLEGPPLEVGERVYIAADIRCGQCYNCRNIYGFPWCLNHTSYGDVISCDKPPHLFGGYADKMYILEHSDLFRVPRNLPNEIALLAEQMAVAYGSFGRAAQSPITKEGYAPGDTVVIQGVGPLGLCNALMARMMGAGKIIAVDKSEFRLRIATELCSAETISLSEYPKLSDRVSRVNALTDGIGADVVIECTGDSNVISEGLEMLRIGGTYLVEGAFVEDVDTRISPSRQILAKNARIIGVSGMPHPAYGRVLKMMDSYRNIIPFEKMITHRFDVEEAAEAMKVSISPDSGKVALGSMR
ncbi:MAG: zinc-binding dehydrogenase [Thaumarchaeota archaeon]|nr:zinc-binding dehydrogenase [Nitrososphaerota archaeon]